MLEQLNDEWRFENPRKGKEVIIFEMPVPKDIEKFVKAFQERADKKDVWFPPNVFNSRTKVKSCIATTNSLVYKVATADDRVIDYE